MAIKLADTAKPMGDFPVAEAIDIDIQLPDGTYKSLQEMYQDGQLGGDGAISTEEGNALEKKDDGLYINLDDKLSIQQDAADKNKFLVTDDDGKITFADGESAENIPYENVKYPDWDNTKKALDGIIEKLDYIEPEILTFTSDADAIYEIGETVPSITFAWTLNKDVTAQTLTDVIITDETSRTATYDTPLSATKIFTLEVTDGENNANKSLTVSFQNKIYWGSAAIQAEYDSAFILGLANKRFSTTKVGAYNMTVASGEYGFIAFPLAFGTMESWFVGGFDTTVEDCGTVSFTNPSGGIANYKIYRTGRSGLGSIKAEIK